MTTSEALEIGLVNPAYWHDHVPQLVQILRAASERGRAGPISDPSGYAPSRETMATIVNPGYWAGRPRELADALGGAPRAENDRGARGSGVGAAPSGQERLTLTVEEAATALGISRAFAYEAVRRGEIPSIRIGRRVLVPRSALQKLIEGSATERESAE